MSTMTSKSAVLSAHTTGSGLIQGGGETEHDSPTAHGEYVHC